MAAFKQSRVSTQSRHDLRLKRLRIRCWRRGIREIDLLLGGFFDACSARLDDAGLSALEGLLDENDHDAYGWITGAAEAPAKFATLIGQIRAARTIKF